MLRFAEEVAYDLAGMFINPDSEPCHPGALKVVLSVMGAALVLALAVIYAEDGVICL